MIRAVLTDVEGTTSRIAFVRDVLIPYAQRSMPEFVSANARAPEVAAALDDVRRSIGAKDATLEELTATLVAWSESDRKDRPLKTLQGLIWERGYREGLFEAHVYDDAFDALQRLHRDGVELYVFSSGSVWAQRLFFRYSTHGDMTPLFRGHFDTAVGAKSSVEAYRTIVAAIGRPAEELLYLSDAEAELDAARAAGMRTLWIVRREDRNPSDAELVAARHPHARSMEQAQPHD